MGFNSGFKGLKTLTLVGEITTVFDEIVQTPKYKVCKNVESCHVKARGTYCYHRTSK